MALATDALEWRTQREQDIRDAYADKNRWTALDYVTDQHDYSFKSIQGWPLDAAVTYRPTDRAALLLGSLKAACSLEDIVETTSLKVTVVVTMCAQEMKIAGAPTDWTKYFQQQDVFHIQCHLEDTTLKPARPWLEQIPDLVASCLQPVVGTGHAGGRRGQIHARALSLLWWHQSERGGFVRLARCRL